MKKIGLSLLFILAILAGAAIWNNSESDPDFLDGQFSEIEVHFKNKDVHNPSVSKGSVAWHLDHTLKAINNISEEVLTSVPADYESKFNMQRVFVHTTGYIPRGAAQASARVTPPPIVSMDSLQLQLDLAKENLKRFSDLDENAYFKHPVFNNLNRDQTRRFLEIHTKHHLKIIEDILKE